MSPEKPKVPKKGLNNPSLREGSKPSFSKSKSNLKREKENVTTLRKKEIFRDKGEEEDYISSIDPKKVFLGLRRHFFLLVVSVVVFAFGGWIASKYLAERFIAESFLVYKEEQSHRIGGGFQVTQYSLDTVIEMMNLPIHFRKVKSILGLKDSVDELMDRTWVEAPGGKSNLIKVACQSDNPQFASDIVNTLSTVLVKHSEELRRTHQQQAHQYFLTRSNEVELEIEENDRKLAAFKVENPHFELSSGNSRLIDEIMQAESDYQKASLQYNSYLIEYENLQREVTNFPEQAIKQSFESSPLKSRVHSTEMALLEARTRYAVDNPKVKILESSLFELRKMLGENTLKKSAEETIYVKNPLKEKLDVELMHFQGRLRSAKRLKEDLAKIVAEKKKGLETLPEEQLLYARLRHKKVVFESEQEELQKAVQSLEALIALGKGDLELYQSSEDPRKMVSRWDGYLSLFPLFGALSGIVAGVILAAFLEATDRRLVTAKQVELAYKIPCLQVLPHVPKLTQKNTEQELLFYIRELYERLTLLGPEHFYSLAVVSATEGEGKTTLAYQLALYLGKRLDEKVLIISFDPEEKLSMSCSLNYPEASLEDWLRGGVTMRDIVSSGVVDLIRSSNEEETKELLQTEAFDQLWESCKKVYDKIIIDVPGVIDDVLYGNLTRLADQTLYLVGAAKTKRNQIDSSLEALSEIGTLPSAIVLNAVPKIYISDERIRAERKRRMKKMRAGKSPLKKTSPEEV